MKPNDETNNGNQHNMVKTPNWQGTDQMVIYKHGRGVELGSTKKQLQLSGQRRASTHDLQISSPAPLSLDQAGSLPK